MADEQTQDHKCEKISRTTLYNQNVKTKTLLSLDKQEVLYIIKELHEPYDGRLSRTVLWEA